MKGPFSVLESKTKVHKYEHFEVFSEILVLPYSCPSCYINEFYSKKVYFSIRLNHNELSQTKK